MNTESFIVSILLLLLSIFIHEFGHMFFAYIVGLKIEDIFIGFGKNLFSFRFKQTSVSVNLLPIGGRIFISNVEKPLWKGVLFAIGGPFANILFAFIISFFLINVLKHQPIWNSDITNVIGYIEPNSNFDLSGISSGDILISVNDSKVNSIVEFIENIFFFSGEDNQYYDVLILRDKEVLKVNLFANRNDFYKIQPLKKPYSKLHGPARSIFDKPIYSNEYIIGKRNSEGVVLHVPALFNVAINGKVYNIRENLINDGDNALSLPFIIDNNMKIGEYRSNLYDANLHYTIPKGAKLLSINYIEIGDMSDINNILQSPSIPIVFDATIIHIPIAVKDTDCRNELIKIDVSKDIPDMIQDTKVNFTFIDLVLFYIQCTIRIIEFLINGSFRAIEMINGPVKIMYDIRNNYNNSIFDILNSFIFLNIQWAIINMMPLYFLDGGNIIAQVLSKMFHGRYKDVNYLYFLISWMLSFIFLIYRLIF